MDYDNTKIYGTIVNEMATEFNKGHDIYESAAVLPKHVNRHYVFSRYACKELYMYLPLAFSDGSGRSFLVATFCECVTKNGQKFNI